MARVLVVEDNPANLELVSYLLRARGHDVATATSGVEGLAAAHDHKPDLILLDIGMPGMDGFEVARSLRADPALRTTPVVAVTAIAMVGDRDRILAAGFDGYLSKPIDPERFEEQISPFLPAGAEPLIPTKFVAASTETVTLRGAVAGIEGRGRVILVVDDRPENLDLARGILEPHGFVVVTATGVAEAMRVLHRGVKPILILSDLHMKQESGLELLRSLRLSVRWVSIPFIIHSATAANSEDRTRALALGATQFLSGPIEPLDLLREITCYAE